MSKYIFAGLFVAIFDYGTKFPIILWIYFFAFANFSIYIITDSYLTIKKVNKNDFAVLLLIAIFLSYLSIYKSDGWLIYPCIFTILSMIAVVIIVIVRQKIQDKKRTEIIQSKPKQAKPKKPKSQIQPKKTLTFKNVKLNHKSKFDERK